MARTAAKPRTIRLTSPPMRGDDVRLLQVTINRQYRTWGVAAKIAEDGVYGQQTRAHLRTVLYGLGIEQRRLDNGVTPELRVKLRRKRLTRAERRRYEARAPWRRRLVKRYRSSSDAVAAAVRFGRAHVGVTERPPGSNSGPQITAWLRAVEVGPAPWCGAFVNACLQAAGFPAQPWLRYCPWIEARARAGEDGWSWHAIGDARPGDLVLYGIREAVHVGLYVGRGVTVEGNTSSDNRGSQDNGGGVFLRRRNLTGGGGFPARGVARPPYRDL
jgi:hypothetical protein